jgi:hypothetical protein
MRRTVLQTGPYGCTRDVPCAEWSPRSRVSGPCPSPGILNMRTQRFGNWVSGEGRKAPTQLGPLERDSFSHAVFPSYTFRIPDDGQSPEPPSL